MNALVICRHSGIKMHFPCFSTFFFKKKSITFCLQHGFMSLVHPLYFPANVLLKGFQMENERKGKENFDVLVAKACLCFPPSAVLRSSQHNTGHKEWNITCETQDQVPGITKARYDQRFCEVLVFLQLKGGSQAWRHSPQDAVIFCTQGIGMGGYRYWGQVDRVREVEDSVVSCTQGIGMGGYRYGVGIGMWIG